MTIDNQGIFPNTDVPAQRSTPHLCPKCNGECVIPIPNITAGTRTCPVCKGEGVIWDRYQAPQSGWITTWPPITPIGCGTVVGQTYTMILTNTTEPNNDH